MRSALNIASEEEKRRISCVENAEEGSTEVAFVFFRMNFNSVWVLACPGVAVHAGLLSLAMDGGGLSKVL